MLPGVGLHVLVAEIVEEAEERTRETNRGMKERERKGKGN
jgi:hypothetical protein